MTKYAEEMSFWTTDVDPYRSQGELMAMLNKFGAANFQVTAGQSMGANAWQVRFDWRGETYRIVFLPHPCREPDTMIMRNKHPLRMRREQAVYQMAREAVIFVKAVLNHATSRPEVLFGFKELPGMGARPDGLPYTAAELDTAQLTTQLQPLALPRPIFDEAEYTEDALK